MSALGFSIHTGWAEVVAVGGEPVGVLLRRRIVICDPELPRQAYHAVAEEGAEREVIELVRASARDLAWMEIEAVLGELAAGGHAATAAGVPSGSAPLPGDVDAILKSHMMLHHAEGDMYREVIASVTESCSLAVARFPQKGLYGSLGEALGVSAEVATDSVAAMGAGIGRPWVQDQKRAAAAAWYALAVSSA